MAVTAAASTSRKHSDANALSGSLSVNGLAGGAAAGTTLAIFFPFDTLKTTMQTTKSASTVETARAILRHGVRGFFRGFSMAVAEHTANRAILFGGGTFVMQQTPAHWPRWKRDAVGGMGAGLVKTFLLHPFDTIKTRWQLGQPAWPAEQPLRAFGSGLYQGIAPAATRSGVGMAIWLNARNGFEATLPEWMPGRHFAAGMLASCVNDLITFPLDTLKKNLQAVRQGEATASSVVLGEARAVAGRLWREGGPLRFYRGIGPQLFRRGLDGGVLNWCYVRYKERLEEWVGR